MLACGTYYIYTWLTRTADLAPQLWRQPMVSEHEWMLVQCAADRYVQLDDLTDHAPAYCFVATI